MSNTYPRINKTTVFVLLTLVIVSMQIGWWIVLSGDESLSYAQVQTRFVRPYPSFLSSASMITWINLLITGICWFWSVRAVARGLESRWIVVALVWSSLIVLWLGFSLS